MEIEIPESGAEEVGTVVVSNAEMERQDPVNLQMVMVSSSMNHEYTRKELEKTRSYARQQELLARLSNLKNLYFSARKRLFECSPERLEMIEKELQVQKNSVLSEHNLH